MDVALARGVARTAALARIAVLQGALAGEDRNRTYQSPCGDQRGFEDRLRHQPQTSPTPSRFFNSRLWREPAPADRSPVDSRQPQQSARGIPAAGVAPCSSSGLSPVVRNTAEWLPDLPVRNKPARVASRAKPDVDGRLRRAPRRFVAQHPGRTPCSRQATSRYRPLRAIHWTVR